MTRGDAACYNLGINYSGEAEDMGVFRFAVMGAGKIAVQFCEAVGLTEGCCVAAVASKSMERAESFAEANGIPAAYNSYEEMLRVERPDCVYIATTTDAHYALSMLCLDYRVPVLCEKAMFMNSAEAETVFARARELNVFVMEALWSRFLPATNIARRWVSEGCIGSPVYADANLCYIMDKNPENRYFSPKLGGGTAFDLTVYGWHLIKRILDRPVLRTTVEAVAGPTGVDVTELVMLRFEGGIPASIKSSFMTFSDNTLTVQGSSGKIVVPNFHCAAEALLYNADGTVAEHFKDTQTQNGFTYEIAEVMRCIREGHIESDVVPHRTTLECAKMFDLINEQKEP